MNQTYLQNDTTCPDLSGNIDMQILYYPEVSGLTDEM